MVDQKKMMFNLKCSIKYKIQIKTFCKNVKKMIINRKKKRI